MLVAHQVDMKKENLKKKTNTLWTILPVLCVHVKPTLTDTPKLQESPIKFTKKKNLGLEDKTCADVMAPWYSEVLKFSIEIESPIKGIWLESDISVAMTRVSWKTGRRWQVQSILFPHRCHQETQQLPNPPRKDTKQSLKFLPELLPLSYIFLCSETKEKLPTFMAGRPWLKLLSTPWIPAPHLHSLKSCLYFQGLINAALSLLTWGPVRSNLNIKYFLQSQNSKRIEN